MSISFGWTFSHKSTSQTLIENLPGAEEFEAALLKEFEKMLYDNALLIMAYLEGYQVAGDQHFNRVTKEILHYVKRDMTSPGGAFYSATDADSLTPKDHREEGYFFTWTPEELEDVLGKDRAEIVKTYYAVRFTGNFEGRHILNTPKTAAEIADDLNMSEKRLQAIIAETKELLFQLKKTVMPNGFQT